MTKSWLALPGAPGGGYWVKAGANLTGADLTELDLKGVIANEDTIWPEGFDPVAAGVIFD